MKRLQQGLRRNIVSAARKEVLHIAARSAAEPLRQRGWAQSLVGEDVGSIITRRYFSSKAASSAELLKKMLASLNCVVGRLEVVSTDKEVVIK